MNDLDTLEISSGQVELFHTATGQRLHIPACPYVVGVALTPANPIVRSAMDVCSWCQAEIDGVGRTYHDTIEAALEDFNADHAVRAELARLLRLAEHDTVYVPHSRSYLAVAKDGQGVAWAGKTYVAYRDRPFVPLPDFVAGGGSGGTSRAGAWGDACPACFTVRSLNGSCGC